MALGPKLLRTHLDKTGTTNADFARESGLTPVEVAHYLVGRRVPSLAKAVAIEDATNGAVPARSWVDNHKPKVRQ